MMKDDNPTKISTNRKSRKFLGFLWDVPSESWDSVYQWTCDLCGKKIYFSVCYWDYNGWCGGDYFSSKPKTLEIEYGIYNRRKISICPTHSDTQISKKLEELKD